MDNIGIFVLVLRGLMAVALLGFTGFALFILWKDLHPKTIKPKKKIS